VWKFLCGNKVKHQNPKDGNIHERIDFVISVYYQTNIKDQLEGEEKKIQFKEFSSW